MSYILSIDQGTTSTRAIIFDADMNIIATANEEFTQHFPNSGWVEHDPKDLLNTCISTCRDAISKAGISGTNITAIGITNQRETTIVWDKHTGEPIYNAIVWQDRRTSNYCLDLKSKGYEDSVIKKTGLLLDPYFSSTKLAWLLDNVEGARNKAEQGQLLFGTVDTWIIWNLTGGKAHVTDATNAARTMLYDIHKGCWSSTMANMLNIPISMLPNVLDCAADFGVTETKYFEANIPIYGIAGDQQAATIGQACFKPGMLKSTYGTGCFALLNTGENALTSSNRLLTTIGYQLNGKPTYALEGSIFIAGAAVQWLRDALKIISKASDTEGLAIEADTNQELILVPAFTGLGAPYWNADSKGAIFGLSRNSGTAEFAKATLESVGYQTRDLLEAMKSDWQDESGDNILRVDGGMTASNYTMQFLADITNSPVDRPKILESTALGVAWLAGQHAGVYPAQEEFAKKWKRQKRFMPNMDNKKQEYLYLKWKRAVRSTIEMAK